MTLIFSTTAELKQYASGISDQSLYFEDIKPDAETAQDYYLQKVLGETLLASLQSQYQNHTLAGAMLLLWQKSMSVVANLTLYHFMPSQYSILSSGGDRTTSTEQAERSPLWAFRQKREAYLTKGMRAIDALYLFLEANAFPDWVSSSAYTEFKQYIINTTSEFNQFVRIADSRNTFLAVLPDMANVETNTISDAVTEDLLTDLKTKYNANTLNADEKQVYKLLQNATANFAMARAANKLTFKFTPEGIVSVSTLAENEGRKEEAANNYRLDAEINMWSADAASLLKRAIDQLNAKASPSLFADWYNSSKYNPQTSDSTVQLPDFGNAQRTGTFFIGGK